MTKGPVLVLPAAAHPALVKAVRDLLQAFKPPPLEPPPSSARTALVKQIITDALKAAG
jgi:hypothetical protein